MKQKTADERARYMEFFCFRGEDGLRVRRVTGVQAGALKICY